MSTPVGEPASRSSDDVDRVDASVAVDRSRRAACPPEIRVEPPADRRVTPHVVAAAAVDPVVAGAAEDRVVAAAAEDHVVVAAAGEIVAAVRADDAPPLDVRRRRRDGDRSGSDFATHLPVRRSTRRRTAAMCSRRRGRRVVDDLRSRRRSRGRPSPVALQRYQTNAVAIGASPLNVPMFAVSCRPRATVRDRRRASTRTARSAACRRPGTCGS